MEHKIVMIGKDGSVITSQDEISEPMKGNQHDYYFLKDIYNSKWFQEQQIPFHPEKKLVWQLPEMVMTGIVIMLDLSYQNKEGIMQHGVQITTPAIDRLTTEQKDCLYKYYEPLKEKKLQSVMIDCVKSDAPLISESFYDIDGFYQHLGIKENKEGKRQR